MRSGIRPGLGEGQIWEEGALGRKSKEQGWDLEDEARESLASGVRFKGAPKKFSNNTNTDSYKNPN